MLRTFSSLPRALEANPARIAALPRSARACGEPPWWEILTRRARPRVVAEMPFMRADGAASLFALAHAMPEPSGEDFSLVVLRAGSEKRDGMLEGGSVLASHGGSRLVAIEGFATTAADLPLPLRRIDPEPVLIGACARRIAPAYSCR